MAANEAIVMPDGDVRLHKAVDNPDSRLSSTHGSDKKFFSTSVGPFESEFIVSDSFVDFAARMLQQARGHEVAMVGLSPEQQVKFIQSKIRHSDVTFAVFSSIASPIGHALYVIRGANILAGSGFNLEKLEEIGKVQNLRPVTLQRELRLTAFLVRTYMEARFLDIAYGDSAGCRLHRKNQQRDGGRQAVENMQQAATPYGRAFAEKNPHLTSSFRQ